MKTTLGLPPSRLAAPSLRSGRAGRFATILLTLVALIGLRPTGEAITTAVAPAPIASRATRPVARADAPGIEAPAIAREVPPPASDAAPGKRRPLRRALRRFAAAETAEKSAQGFAVASLTCAIVGFAVAAFVLGALAIIFAGIALSRIKRGLATRGNGVAIAGLVVGIVVFLLGCINVVNAANEAE